MAVNNKDEVIVNRHLDQVCEAPAVQVSPIRSYCRHDYDGGLSKQWLVLLLLRGGMTAKQSEAHLCYCRYSVANK
jgi:hypothetical protein